MPKKRKKDYNLILRIVIFIAIIASLQLIDIYTNQTTIPPKKIYLELFLFCSIFIFASYKKLKITKNWKASIVFGVIALIVFTAVLNDNTSLNQKLEYGIATVHNKELHFDRTSVLGNFDIHTVSNSYPIWDLTINNENELVKILINVENKETIKKLTWLSSWSGNSFNNQAIVEINGNKHDITNGYLQTKPDKKRFFQIDVDNEEIVEGENEIIFRVNKKSEPVNFYRMTLELYYHKIG